MRLKTRTCALRSKDKVIEERAASARPGTVNVGQHTRRELTGRSIALSCVFDCEIIASRVCYCVERGSVGLWLRIVARCRLVTVVLEIWAGCSR